MSDDAEDETENEICGEPNKPSSGGGVCQNPPSNPDGSCWIPSHGEAEPGDDAPTPGRPTKLTVQRQEHIASYLEEGYSIKVASRLGGIDHTTYHSWMKRGRVAEENGEDTIYRDFYERMERARAEGERRLTSLAHEYAREAKSFGAIMELLRKRYPESWGGRSDETMSAEKSLRVEMTDGREGEKKYRMRPDETD
ncbi:MAG: hypothetical protein R3324_08065 [Halobacteriales archaeon]|nr:hypothetical protein [Halobacteriales archaeon]